MRAIPVLALIGCIGSALPVAIHLAAEPQAIVTRDQWGAKPTTLEIPRHKPVRLTIHHTATMAKPNASIKSKLKSLQAFSQSESKLADGRVKKAWGDIPYHFYIDANGGVGEGRAVDLVGDTNTRYDPTGHIAVVLEGNFDKEAPSPAQVEALVGLLATLAKRYAIEPDHVGAHRQFAQTACPGKNMMTMLPDVLAAVQNRRAREN